MRRNDLFFSLLSLFFLSCVGISAQISHGGKPFFLQNSVLRSSPSGLLSGSQKGVFDMPAFNLDSIAQEDRLNEGNMLRSYHFAHKIFTNIEKRKDAALTVLPDGTKVWLINIRSQGAYSINVLLTDFELPPGGKLFVYNSDHSHVIGSFDYRNNSPERILPIQPVAGESIFLEYSEPVDVPFEGNFTVSEVNHDYRDVLRREPGGNDNGSEFSCMPDAICSEVDKSLVHATVLLMINGTAECSGVLVNNTENDGTPCLLTAVHCLNDSLQYGVSKNMEHYITRSGTVIAFFNFNRPVCGSQLKGTEEMSIAEAYPRVIMERKDVALLELREKPPVYYNAYYAGWNMDESGGIGIHENLHHPVWNVKKYGKTEADLSISSPFYFLDPESHWEVPSWTIGSTDAGSSGSPLFDQNGLVIGTLTGGGSVCKNSSPAGYPDYFTVLYKSWETTDPNNQLKTYLDPNNKGLTQQQGMDPNAENPLARLSNMDFPAGDTLNVSTLNPPNSGYVFGSNNLKTTEFAEEFTVTDAVEVFGAYLFVPPLSANGITGVKVSIYSGTTFPETLLQTQDFSPQYLNYSDTTGFILQNKNMKSFGTETFVLFNEPVKIASGKFFISYKIDNSSIPFCVYNAKFAGADRQNTAWVKDPSKGWITAVAYSPTQGAKTSLAIQPLVRNTKIDSLPEVPGGKDNPLFFDSKNHILWLLEPASEPVPVNVYSLTGTLMEKVQFNKGEKSVLLTKRVKGTIGIVQLTLSDKTYSKKILFY